MLFRSTCGNKRKIIGAFLTCVSGHKLEWSSELINGDPKFDCENCKTVKDTVEGRWLCKRCNYDICESCRPRRHGRIDNRAKNELIGKCTKEHDMKFIPCEDKKDVYLCDKCAKAYRGIVPRWHCEFCSVDLCHACLAPPADADPEVLKLEIDTCPKHHKLEFVVTDTYTGIYTCYICTKLGDPHNGRWACLYCDISICPICKPIGEELKGTVSIMTRRLACDKGHILRFGCKPRPAGGELICNKCKTKIVDEWRWCCTTCDFDICTNCRPEPEGRRDLTCASNHKLAFSNLPIGNITYGRCDKCHKTFKLSAGRYCCFECEYECCNDCVNIIAEIGRAHV